MQKFGNYTITDWQHESYYNSSYKDDFYIVKTFYSSENKPVLSISIRNPITRNGTRATNLSYVCLDYPSWVLRSDDSIHQIYEFFSSIFHGDNKFFHSNDDAIKAVEQAISKLLILKVFL